MANGDLDKDRGRTRFVYSVIRFCPMPHMGERVNIGVIVGRDSQWLMKLTDDFSRARALDFAKSLGRILHHIETAWDIGSMTEGKLDQMHHDMQNGIQLSFPAPVMAKSLDGAMEFVFDLMIPSAS